MNRIPIHKVNCVFPGEIVAFRKYCGNIAEFEHPASVDHAHRDDYYMFVFMEKGYVKLHIDFTEHEFAGATILCILPGQVHVFAGHADTDADVDCWFLAADPMLVNDEHRDVFEKLSFAKSNPELTGDNVCDLKYCAAAIHRRLENGEQLTEHSVVRDLLSAWIGMFAEIYRKGFPASVNNRYGAITSRFKALLSAGYRTIKSPSQYASQLNISPVYLNEAVKKTTGMSVSNCIRNEIITQAKRLLFYTNMNVKEISGELGYEDYAYFTRLFTKVSALSPIQFRRKYLK